MKLAGCEQANVSRLGGGGRRGIGQSPPALRYERLMEASERRLDAAMHSGIPAEELIACRIFDNPRDFSRWEAQHAGLMRRIVVAPGAVAQKCELLTASLALIHRKALFEYLQTSRLTGRPRERLIEHFHATVDYRTAVISEHGNYLRSAASYLCSSHVGTRLMLDDIFGRPLLEYEQLYGDYFRLYCNTAIGEAGAVGAGSMRPLLAVLKRQVGAWRNALLALTHSSSGVWRAPVPGDW